MPNLPSHEPLIHSPRPQNSKVISDLNLNHVSNAATSAPPPALVSPAFTPPSTPGTDTPSSKLKTARSAVVSTNDSTAQVAPPRLLEKLPEVNCVVRARIPTVTGAEMFLHLYHNDVDNKEHLAIVFGSSIRSRSLDAPRPGESELDRMIRGAYVGRLHPGRLSSRHDPSTSEKRPTSSTSNTSTEVSTQRADEQEQKQEQVSAPLVRIHSECYTGETAWSARCDCGEQLDEAARLMSLPECPGGVIVYLRQEGRGIGLGEKLKAYNLQDLGNDTVEANLLLRHPADARSYGLATAMLLDLGMGGEQGIRLLTNNPDKVRAVEGPNREVTVKERVAMVPLAWKSGGKRGIHSEEIEGYLRTKIGKMGHMLE
ncbi:MAG: GTP cyclohydrolase II [Ramalina farinacea]|uniref:GTP cyclohydrolase II n=1 Tax=Ramalina farinacea TaxID=258253 RepID=A0AA43QLE8_9LECA|nr:GTP cyclohydrolase II [Ramalina farinacea]